MSCSELGHRLHSQQPLNNPLPLGHSVYLCLDTAQENVPVYGSLVSGYAWIDKAHTYSAGAASLLAQNSLNRFEGEQGGFVPLLRKSVFPRSYAKVSMSMVKHRRRGNTIQPVPPGGLEAVVSKIGALFPDMELTVSRPNGTKLNAIVEVN